jgi:hypothetical protein
MPVAVAGAAIGGAAAAGTGFAALGLSGAVAGAAVGGALGMQAQGYLDAQDARKDQAAANQQAAVAREREFQAQTQRAEIQNVRAVRQQIRQQRAAAASIIGRGATTGTLGSSGVAGGVSSVGSQLASNLSYMSDIADTQTASREAAVIAGQAQYNMGVASGNLSQAQAYEKLGGTIFSAAGGFATVFGKPPTTQNTKP